MVRAEFVIDGESLVLKLSGHAGAGKKGSDIVCAASSILCYTAAQVIQYMFGEDKLERPPDILLEDGNAHVIAVPRKENYNECLHTFYVVQAGYALLERNYPKNVALYSFGESQKKKR